MLIATRNKTHIQKRKAQLKELDMKDLGEAKNILGMKINRDKSTGRLKLSQENYVLKMLERFNMVEARSVTTPLAVFFRFPPVSVQTPKKKRIRCLEYHMLVR